MSLISQKFHNHVFYINFAGGKGRDSYHIDSLIRQRNFGAICFYKNCKRIPKFIGTYVMP